jgi:hypothetical protein
VAFVLSECKLGFCKVFRLSVVLCFTAGYRLLEPAS